MTEQPNENAIAKLLEDLRSEDAYRRRMAAETIGEQKLADERLVDVLKTLASQDSNSVVRSAARSALNQLGVELPGEEALPKPESERPPISPDEKRRDFLIGFFGWWTINVVLWELLRGDIFANLFVFPVNVLVLIILAFRRGWMALGILSAFGVNFVIASILGLSFNAICWIPFTSAQ